MKTFEYTLRFTIPAFLGDAEQNGAWRTPPIKALLRQFWRMDYARRARWNVDLNQMRAAEAALFGHAGDRDNSRQSRLRIRLDHWDQGRLSRWQAETARVRQPEVERPIDPQLYLGYGPLVLPKGAQATTLKKNAAIQAKEEAKLRIAAPEEHVESIANALQLASRFGSLGGRSRNGWGSFELLGEQVPACTMPLRDWREALALDWPHALGTNGGSPLLWATEEMADWQAVMRTLAEVKIHFRTALKFTGGNNSPVIEPRHWLSYPVTNHSVTAWGGNARLPNSLRFKVARTASGKLRGLVFHMPCLPSASFHPDRRAIESAWQQVHDALGEKLSRITLEDLA